MVDEHLQPGFNHYPSYTPNITADRHAAWVFPVNSRQASAFSQKAASGTGGYKLLEMEGYTIYLPVS